ncbi:DinB family protein [Paenibacillus sp. DXFW5]|uniref:DinB family protein n=1 Tax=Paenibacillus rhizolycopersici TaxID=2780073 RepID=A0ABS2H0Y5_9BACL|nr:DinB family protein [Paenibacillus rhizolycopersici]MBM6994166.1 DinB family protein [Paenibacillus rhizolycopersici]
MTQVNFEAFLNTHGQLISAIDGLSEEQTVWKPKPESWSVLEVLSHLVDHSIVISFRIRDILAETEARLPAFNQDAWVSGQYANSGNVADVLQAFHALLLYNSLLLSRLDAADLKKTGVNAKGETVAITDIVEGFTRHVQRHLEQINRIKQAAEVA